MTTELRLDALEKLQQQLIGRFEGQCHSYLEALETMTARVATLEERIIGERGLWFRATRIEMDLEHLKRLPDMVQKLSETSQHNALLLQTLAEARTRQLSGVQQIGVTILSGIILGILLHLLVPKPTPHVVDVKELQQQINGAKQP